MGGTGVRGQLGRQMDGPVLGSQRAEWAAGAATSGLGRVKEQAVLGACGLRCLLGQRKSVWDAISLGAGGRLWLLLRSSF